MPYHNRPLRCVYCFGTECSEYDKHRIGHSRCYSCGKEFTKKDEQRDIFHQLWSAASQCGDYPKVLWKRLAYLAGW